MQVSANVRDGPNVGGRAPLHTASFHGYDAAARLLLDVRARLLASAARASLTLLHAQRGASVHDRSSDGHVPLHDACSNCQVTTARLLVNVRACGRRRVRVSAAPLTHNAMCVGTARCKREWARQVRPHSAALVVHQGRDAWDYRHGAVGAAPCRCECVCAGTWQLRCRVCRCARVSCVCSTAPMSMRSMISGDSPLMNAREGTTGRPVDVRARVCAMAQWAAFSRCARRM